MPLSYRPSGEMILPYPNKEKYPKQRLMIVDLDGYTYGVPYLRNEQEVVLKTIYPNRKYKELLEKKNEK